MRKDDLLQKLSKKSIDNVKLNVLIDNLVSVKNPSKEFEVRLISLFDIIGTAALTFTNTGKIKYLSDSFTKLTGYRKCDSSNIVNLLKVIFPLQSQIKRLNRNIDKIVSAKDSSKILSLNLSIKSIDGRYIPIKFKLLHFRKTFNLLLLESMLDSTEIAKLIESEKRYRNIFDKENDAVYLWEIISKNKIGKCIEANEKACKMLGYSKEEFKNLYPDDITSTEYKDKVYNYIGELFDRGWHTFRTKHVTKNSNELEVEVNTKIISIDRKRYVLSVVRDISNFRSTEKALEESEEMFRMIVENSYSGIVIIGSDMKINYCNDRLCKILNTSSDEIVGRTVLDFLDERSRHLVASRFEQRKKGNIVPSRYQVVAIRKDGVKRDVELTTSLMKKSDGSIISITQVDDITVRKKQEEALRNIAKGISEKIGDHFYTSLVNYLGNSLDMDYVFIGELEEGKIDKINTIVLWGKGKILENFKYELPNTPCANVVNQKMCCYSKDVSRLFPKDELLKEMNIEGYIGAPLVNSEGKVIGIFVVLSEKEIVDQLTAESVIQIFATRSASELERLMNEKSLIKAKEEAENADKLKSEFLAQISHEIRTPINTILSFSSLIKDEVYEKVDDDLRPMFSSITSAGNRITRTIDLMLNMSEIQSGSYSPIPKTLDIFDNIIEDVYLQYSHQALEKGIDLKVENNAKNAFVTCDQYTMGQIFNNLVDNAIKYTVSGSIKIIITKNESQNIIVKVKDTGIGIAENYMPFMFTPFTQEEQGYTRRYEGNGLGLALVKKCCELNNAFIKVESRKGKGTCFTVIFNETN